jgi:hypothetical protein
VNRSATARPSRSFRRAGARRPDRLPAVAAALLLLLVRPAAAEILVNPRGWKFPNILTSAKEAIRPVDRTPLIPGKETLLKGYRKGDGTGFMTYEIEGRVFGVEIDTNGKPPFEFSIMDTDGDRVFETKIQNKKGERDQAYVPQWVIDHYFSLHPELKNPSGPVRPIPPSLKVEVASPPAARPTPKPVVEPPKEAVAQPNP